MQPLTDVTLLRRFAEALAISHEMFGLVPSAYRWDGRHAETVNNGMLTICGPSVVPDFRLEDGDDPVRRRELLAGAAGLASAAFMAPVVSRENRGSELSAGFEDLLYGRPSEPASLAILRAAISSKREEFQTARYDRLSSGLPSLVGTAVATRQCASSGQEGTASRLLAEVYIVAANFMVKLNDDPLALTLADRALQSAEAGDDPLTLADARRAVATVLRRTGRRSTAHGLLLSAASAIEPKGNATPEHLSMYGTLMQVAAYTAAVDGNRGAAHHLIGEARTAADRLGQDANYRYTAFGPANVAVYQVSIARVLGDSGTAIDYARMLNPSAIPTPERRGRYWIDVARAYHQWNKPEHCYRALRSAEQAAPAEVRYRPPVRRMTDDLLRSNRRLPGLHAFARRIGMPAL